MVKSILHKANEKQLNGMKKGCALLITILIGFGQFNLLGQSGGFITFPNGARQPFAFTYFFKP